MRFGTLTLAALLLCGGLASSVQAQVIADRTTLNTLLGGGGTTETFETFSISNGIAVPLGISTLDSTTIAQGQGPGLVASGVTFTDPFLQWNGNNYFNLPTKTLSGTNNLSIVFAGAPTAFGVDLLAYSGFPDTITATVFDTSANPIYTTTTLAVPNPTPVFFGYQNAGGIGSIVLHGNIFGFSPVIDNLTFGVAAVPEPGSVALLIGLGVSSTVFLRRRKQANKAA